MKSTRKSAASFLALAALVALCQPPPKAEAQPLFVQLAYTCPQTPQDQVAVDSIMGHVDPSMGAVYRETIGDARLKAVTDAVHAWLFSAVGPVLSP